MEVSERVLSSTQLCGMLDISAVRTNSTDNDIQTVIAYAKKYHCYLVTILPSQTVRAKKILEANITPKLGGNVGFPSGGQTTPIKVKETRELVSFGVDEIDMVIDVAALLSGRTEDVYHEINEVVQAAEGKPVKVILECHYLTDDFIRIGCDQAIKAGATFVKTGTGWAPTGATLKNIALIKAHVGNAIKIKASGGIRDIETISAMYKIGATRFGISMNSAIRIMANLSSVNNNDKTPMISDQGV